MASARTSALAREAGGAATPARGRAVRPARRVISLSTARRLAISAQGLDAGSVDRWLGRDAVPRRRQTSVTPSDVTEVVRRITYVQLDPISVVARSPMLVLWARLGAFAESVLEAALYERRDLYEYWAHAAAIVPTSDYPVHQWRMVNYATGDRPWSRRVREWLAENSRVAEAIRATLAVDGPLPAQAFVSLGPKRWETDGWNEGRDVDRLLTIMWMKGEVIVAGRPGGKRIWQLTENWFPPSVLSSALSVDQAVRLLAGNTLRALGVGTQRLVNAPLRGWQDAPALERTLLNMISAGEVVPVSIAMPDGGALKGDWLVHAEHVETIDRIEAGEWVGRSVLLSPFDNLLIDRGRAEVLFGFEHRMEIYVPPRLRRYGYYVLPYLHGDRLAGRLDLRADRKAGHLSLIAVHAEPDAARLPGGLRPLRRAVDDLARCCGFDSFAVEPGALGGLPATWAKVLA